MIIISIIVLVGFTALYVLAIKRIWEGRSEYDDSRPPAWWPFSLPLWRGIARAFPVQGAGFILLVAGGVGAEIAGKGTTGYDIGMSVGLVGLLGIILLALPITFFNRPRFLVPPHQRDDPGAIAEWRAAKARR